MFYIPKKLLFDGLIAGYTSSVPISISLIFYDLP